MTARVICPNPSTLSDELLGEAASVDGTPLPVSGLRLRHRVQPNGRAVIEIDDDAGDLIGLMTSTTLPMLSVDAAWRGRAHLADGTRQWWALAVGHATAGDDAPAVTFTRRLGRQRNQRRTVLRPWRLQGLWIAAVPGLYTTVTCRQGPGLRIRRLAPVPRSRAHA